MKILNRLKKIFVGGTWYVGVKDFNADKPNKYVNVPTPKGQWVADPFLFEENGKHFLFCEQYDNRKNKAAISCYEIIDGEATNGTLIIEESYHLSYPCVFKIKDKHYMIPESSANNTIDLYVANEFPLKWSHKKTLLKGAKYVDSTIFYNNSEILLLSYRKVASGYELVVFSLDDDNQELDIRAVKEFNENVGRPAGFLFNQYGNIIRPAQCCQNKYGERILLYQLDRLEGNIYSEHLIHEITVDDVDFPIHVDRIHTINRDSRYEVVDLFKEKIDFLHGIKILKRAYFQK